MGGIGKTTLAKKAYDHLTIRYHFDILAWVTISQEFRSRNVFFEALRCISKGKDYDKMAESELADLVQKNQKGRRYLVVVDDIWSTDVWDSIRGIFPNYNSGSRILLTTRETEVAIYADTSSPHILNLENGWKLLCDKVFGPEHDHPLELEEIGKDIVEKCQGLPLTISVIAGHLSNTAKTLEGWKDVARNLREVVASHPNRCLGVLGLSYQHLPNHLKPCFLSMSSFPEDVQVDTWRLIQLWIAEGFIRTSGSRKSLEEVALNNLEDLISRNLIQAGKRRFNGEIKACGIHDLLREFCLIEAETTKFMHVDRTCPTFPTQKRDVRHFSFQTQYYSADDCRRLLSPVARSIYLFSEKQPSATHYNLLGLLIYRRAVTLEVFSHFKLLRVLAIFNRGVKFRSFPLVIAKLFHLRYLEVRCNSNIPASISELQNLQTLVIHAHLYSDIILLGRIWMMKSLRHIHLGGAGYLPSPTRENIQNKHLAIGMPNLEELSGLCSTKCTNEVFCGIPNLKRLTVRIVYSEEAPLANRLIDMSSLIKLKALKCCWLNSSPDSLKNFGFPTSLTRLTLDGWFEFPWEDISTLAMLPNLEELKLKDQAAYGAVWKLSDNDKFKSLKFLLFRWLNLEHWEASSDNFPNLKRLVLKICEALNEIPTEFGEICTLESIELLDCYSCVRFCKND
ncbi:hypothetical protein BC332_13032 [Capsicum chinense]|nr:hypothetical protein BC332_13032 [Capsicum chinense]